MLQLNQGENSNDDTLIYKTKDIYNIKVKLQRKNLGVLMSIQTLMQKLSTLKYKIHIYIKYKIYLNLYILRTFLFKKTAKNR